MRIKRSAIILLSFLVILTACREAPASRDIGSTAAGTSSDSPSTRMDLTYSDLITGFDPEGIISEDALRMPDDVHPSPHAFKGRLELLSEPDAGEAAVLSGSLPDAYQHLPEFNFSFIQLDDYLIPIQRGLIITDQSTFDYILEPGHIWLEEGDQGFSRASLPFALVSKGNNALFNHLKGLVPDHPGDHLKY